MKNSFTKFSSVGYLKYKNVELVHPSDVGYQAYRIAQIAAYKNKRRADYIPNPTTPLNQASRSVEFVVRSWYGSQANRIIQYDVFYNGVYQRHYKECDIVRVEGDGSITVAEIKATSKPSPSKGAKQLQAISEILLTAHSAVNLVAINVDMASASRTTELNIPSSQIYQSGSGHYFEYISLGLGFLMDFAQSNKLCVDYSLFAAAHQDAVARSSKRVEKQNASLPTVTHYKQNENSQSVLGMLLQEALSKGHCNYKSM